MYRTIRLSCRNPLKIHRVLLVFSLALCARAADEPAADTQRTYQHGGAVVTLKQIRRDHAPICRASLIVTHGAEETFRAEYDDIDAVGDSYGLFVPNEQPPGEYFVVVKIGDYDGRLFIIDKTGKTRTAIGGHYFVFERGQQRYLISEYHSDVAGLLVLNLTTGAIDYASAKSPSTYEEIPDQYQWYRVADEVFFTTYIDATRNGKYSHEEVRNNIYWYDFEAKKLSRGAKPGAILDEARPIEFDFNPHDYSDCECAKAE